MNWSAFQTRVSGKWVLAGEHAVLRGATAIAIPHPEFDLSLNFQPGSSDQLVVLPQSAQAVIQEILLSVQDDRQSQDQVFRLPTGNLELKSSIPIGAGLGSSAALCVAMSRWLAGPFAMPEEEIVKFATRLEHRFHGRSSGMDVAVIAAAEPISFVMPEREGGRGGATSLGIRNLPRFTFHDTGLRTRTSECVLRVEKMREENPTLAMEVDEKMSAASRLAMEGLIRYDQNKSPQALDLIARAMRQAQECFYSWQLVPSEAKKIQDELIAQGALATKITGAGGGGMIVALWK